MLIIKEVEYAVMILDELYHRGSSVCCCAFDSEKHNRPLLSTGVLKKLEARDILGDPARP